MDLGYITNKSIKDPKYKDGLTLRYDSFCDHVALERFHTWRVAYEYLKNGERGEYKNTQ